MPRWRIEGSRAVLECTVVSAPAIRVGRGPVIKRIVIHVSVVSVEAVVAGIGAAVAPVVTVPAGPDMTLAEARPEIGRHRRSAGAAEDGAAQCSRNKTFHEDAQSPMKPGLSLTKRGSRRKSKRPHWLSIEPYVCLTILAHSAKHQQRLWGPGYVYPLRGLGYRYRLPSPCGRRTSTHAIVKAGSVAVAYKGASRANSGRRALETPKISSGMLV